MNKKAIETWIDSHDLSGMISIKKNNKTLFEQSKGYRDYPNQLPIDNKTSFGIASGAKFFTALGIMALVDAGKIGLEDRIFDYVKRPFDSYDSNVTIKQLLTHTSGLPDYFDEDEITGEVELSVPWHQLEKPSDYIAVFPNKPMKFNPGESFHYNNSAFILLAIVIETITGDYYSWIEESVIKKVGLKNTGYYRFDQLPANTAHGYIKQQDGTYKTNIYTLPVRGGGDGGIYTSAPDMHHLWMSFLNGDIVSSAIVDTMLTPWSHTDSLHYGLGVWLEEVNGKYHPLLIGQDYGVTFLTGYHLTTKQSYVLLSNNGTNLWSLVQEVKSL